jgi:hypothetical protein
MSVAYPRVGALHVCVPRYRRLLMVAYPCPLLLLSPLLSGPRETHAIPGDLPSRRGRRPGRVQAPGAGRNRALRKLKADGTLTAAAWSPGAVLMLDVPDESEAARLVAAFPLVQAALITTQIIPLHPSTCDIEDMWRRNAAAVARPVPGG